MGNSTPIRLYTNDSPEGPLSNRGSGIAGIFLGFDRINLLHYSQIIIISRRGLVGSVLAY